MSKKIFGSWSNYEEIEPEWREYGSKTPIEGFPTEEELLFASYGGGCYEGDAHLIYERDGKLYENHGSHCSCYGLENQWAPEETSWEALAIRKRRGGTYDVFLSDHEQEARDAYWTLVDSRVQGDPRKY